jgi:hypothetical protein
VARSVVFYAVLYCGSLCGYWIALGFAFGCAELLETPGWWMQLFQDPLAGIRAWRVFTEIVAIVAASVPIALAIARLGGRRAPFVALGLAFAVFLVATLPWFVVHFAGTWRPPQLLDGIVGVALIVALPVIVWLLRMLPSNNRWSGP